MARYLGDFATTDTVYVYWDTYSGAGASITQTGLAVTDVEIYKDGSATQRASDAGVALLDTDGTDFDGVTGVHGASIDLSDDTDAGFYAVGSSYAVVVSTVTADGQTVSMLAAMFRIPATGGTAYTQAVDGSQANTGAIAKLTATAKTGAQANTGAIAKATATSQAGAQTNTGAIAKATATSEAGALTGAGGIVRETATAKSGAWSGAGAIVRETGKAAAGAWSGSGAIARATSKAVAGAWSGAGGIARAIGKAVAGAWSAVGALVGLAPAHGLVNLTLQARSVELTVDARSADLTVEER
jgi:hypothetical protein